jgi:penicillin-binding protein-related factor A (putative recombinase)
MARAKNTGKPSEQDFETHWQRLGKAAFCFRFADAAEVTGLAGKIVGLRAQPSDFIVVHEGVTSFCEVKSTGSETSFPFSMLKTTQGAFAKFTVTAKGSYLVYIHSLHLGRWFKIPYELVLTTREAGKASIPWKDLEPYSWTPLP